MDPQCPRCGADTKRDGTLRGRQRYRCKRCKYKLPINSAAAAAADAQPGRRETCNEAVIVSHPYDAPPTLDRILEDWGVDREIWRVKEWRPGHSEVSMKVRQADGAEQVVKVTNYHAKVWLIRREPEQSSWPIFTAGELPKMKTVAVKLRGGLRRAVVYPDAQIGYAINHSTQERTELHDERAMGVVAEVIKAVQPDRVVGLGDLLDLTEQSTHFVRKPQFYFQTKPALDRAVLWFHTLRPFVGQWDEISGNHDIRLDGNVVLNSVSAYDLAPGQLPGEGPADGSLSIQALLRLNEFDITYSSPYPDGIVWINENIGCIHGEKIGPKGGQTAMKNLDRPRTSLIAGHAHRVESGHTTVHHHGGQKTYGYYSPGCLCRIDGAVPGQNARPDWQQGFAVVDYDDQLFHVDLVTIFHGTAIWDGKTWEASI